MQSLLRKLQGSHNTPQALCAMGSQVLTSAANFATTVILARTLGLEDFGQFSVCFLLVMIARNFLNGLILVPMSTIGPKLHDGSIRGYRAFLLLNAVSFCAISSVLLGVIIVPLSFAIGAPWLPGLTLGLIGVNILANGADFIRRYHFVYAAPLRALLVDVVRFGVQISCLAALATIFRDSFTVTTALGAMMVGSFAGIAFGFLFYGPMRWSKRLSRAVWPRHRAFIRWMSASVALDAIQGNAPLFIATALLGESALGLVRAVQSLANILNLPFNALQQIAPALSARILAKQGRHAMRRFLVASTFCALIVLLVVLSSIFSVWDVFVSFAFAIDAGIALPIFLIYCLRNVAMVLRLPVILELQSLEVPKSLALGGFIGACTSIFLSFNFTEHLGAMIVPTVNVSIILITMVIYSASIIRHSRMNKIR
ncbi:lipopolysaccharide biosynthesis protein [Monaibacterium marinum]|nr:hypothetical protein [Monaibacterium marinum]